MISYLSSPILGGAGAWLISRWGTTIGLLDRSNDRNSHEGVVPKGDPQITQTRLPLRGTSGQVTQTFWILKSSSKPSGLSY